MVLPGPSIELDCFLCERADTSHSPRVAGFRPLIPQKRSLPARIPAQFMTEAKGQDQKVSTRADRFRLPTQASSVGGFEFVISAPPGHQQSLPHQHSLTVVATRYFAGHTKNTVIPLGYCCAWIESVGAGNGRQYVWFVPSNVSEIFVTKLSEQLRQPCLSRIDLVSVRSSHPSVRSHVDHLRSLWQ